MADIQETRGDAARGSHTAYAIEVGDTFWGNIVVSFGGDWVAVNLLEGQQITAWLRGGSMPGQLFDPELTLLDNDGTPLASVDDGARIVPDPGIPQIAPVDVGLDAYMEFTAPETGTYFFEIEASGQMPDLVGSYTLAIAEWVPPPVCFCNDGGTPGDGLGRIPTHIGGVLDDNLTGSDGADAMVGDAGNDTLRGLGADDSLIGAQGQDVLYGGRGADTLSGGAEADQMFGGRGRDVLNGGRDGDLLDGGVGDDNAWGSVGRDTLLGGEGHDLLRGGQGADDIQGGAGDDTLASGRGFDTLTGGTGADVFVLFGDDKDKVITDFDPTEDVLHLDLMHGRPDADPGGIIDTFAEVVGEDTVFTFKFGARLVLTGITDLEALEDALW